MIRDHCVKWIVGDCDRIFIKNEIRTNGSHDKRGLLDMHRLLFKNASISITNEENVNYQLLPFNPNL